MSIDDILTQAQASATELYSSGVGIEYAQLVFLNAQLARLRIEIKAITSATAVHEPKAADFLRAGLKHMDERAVTHDAPQGERSMAKTVAAFNIIADQDVTEEQGWLFMGLLKKVRSVQGNFNKDNYEDEASYAGLRGECAARDRAI